MLRWSPAASLCRYTTIERRKDARRDARWWKLSVSDELSCDNRSSKIVLQREYRLRLFQLQIIDRVSRTCRRFDFGRISMWQAKELKL